MPASAITSAFNEAVSTNPMHFLVGLGVSSVALGVIVVVFLALTKLPTVPSAMRAGSDSHPNGEIDP